MERAYCQLAPLFVVLGKNITFNTTLDPSDVVNFITVAWNFNGGSGLVPVVTSVPRGHKVEATQEVSVIEFICLCPNVDLS
jgi:hypothetical protein